MHTPSLHVNIAGQFPEVRYLRGEDEEDSQHDKHHTDSENYLTQRLHIQDCAVRTQPWQNLRQDPVQLCYVDRPCSVPSR